MVLEDTVKNLIQYANIRIKIVPLKNRPIEILNFSIKIWLIKLSKVERGIITAIAITGPGIAYPRVITCINLLVILFGLSLFT